MKGGNRFGARQRREAAGLRVVGFEQTDEDAVGVGGLLGGPMGRAVKGERLLRPNRRQGREFGKEARRVRRQLEVSRVAPHAQPVSQTDVDRRCGQQTEADLEAGVAEQGFGGGICADEEHCAPVVYHACRSDGGAVVGTGEEEAQAFDNVVAQVWRVGDEGGRDEGGGAARGEVRREEVAVLCGEEGVAVGSDNPSARRCLVWRVGVGWVDDDGESGGRGGGDEGERKGAPDGEGLGGHGDDGGGVTAQNDRHAEQRQRQLLG